MANNGQAIRSPELDEILDVFAFAAQGGDIQDLKKIDRIKSTEVFERARSLLEPVSVETKRNTYIDMTARRRIPGHQTDTVSPPSYWKRARCNLS